MSTFPTSPTSLQQNIRCWHQRELYLCEGNCGAVALLIYSYAAVGERANEKQLIWAQVVVVVTYALRETRPRGLCKLCGRLGESLHLLIVAHVVGCKTHQYLARLASKLSPFVF